ncbi:MAG: hypothetical protein JW746_08675 [Candidatus Krumholzibacteriota bacterium]|nr:hypothetical protein [Candidatus Krumholzibacteriota bacterium]
MTQYPLTAKEIIFWKEETDETGKHDLSRSGKDYIFSAREYALAVVREKIILPDGLVGRFIPMSGLIEKGFSITAGKLDPHYGRGGEEIRFGLSNLRGAANRYDRSSPLAYIEFFDLRGLKSSKVMMTGYDELIRYMRRSDDKIRNL